MNKKFTFHQKVDHETHVEGGNHLQGNHRKTIGRVSVLNEIVDYLVAPHDNEDGESYDENAEEEGVQSFSVLFVLQGGLDVKRTVRVNGTESEFEGLVLEFHLLLTDVVPQFGVGEDPGVELQVPP
jgi:hypothetical protein